MIKIKKKSDMLYLEIYATQNTHILTLNTMLQYISSSENI